MNKIILCAMDKRKTKEELLENFNAAATYAFYYSSVVAEAACDASCDAAYDEYDLECHLDEYFNLTGEDRAKYQKEADK